MNLHFPDAPPQFRVLRWDGDVMVIVLTHYLRCLTSLGWITVPTGFHSDGLSIPQFAWSVVGPSTGCAFVAGLLHDFLYSKASDVYFKVDRKTADEILGLLRTLLVPSLLHGCLTGAVALQVANTTSSPHGQDKPQDQPRVHFGGTLVPSSFLCIFTSLQTLTSLPLRSFCMLQTFLISANAGIVSAKVSTAVSIVFIHLSPGGVVGQGQACRRSQQQQDLPRCVL